MSSKGEKAGIILPYYMEDRIKERSILFNLPMYFSLFQYPFHIFRQGGGKDKGLFRHGVNKGDLFTVKSGACNALYFLSPI